MGDFIGFVRHFRERQLAAYIAREGNGGTFSVLDWAIVCVDICPKLVNMKIIDLYKRHVQKVQ